MSVVEYKNVSYGPYERNVLDAYIIKAEEPTPALIYFHGGGYVAGNKEEILSSKIMQECLQAGISVVTCNYRFITSDPYPAPMEDGTRAIQFVRSKAKEWGLNPIKIASAGSSAGGHIALWNALKGESAIPDSLDPIEKISSKVSAFIGIDTQASKDQLFYQDIYEGTTIQPNIVLFYGISNIDDLFTPKILKLAEEASAINYMSAEAPPALMVYGYEYEEPRIASDASVDEVIHSPVHGYMLKQKYDELGIPFIFRHGGNPVRQGEITTFLLDCFHSD